MSSITHPYSKSVRLGFIFETQIKIF